MSKQVKNVQLSERFKVLNREADLICGLITSGIEDLRNISKGSAYYYQSFYSLSVGLERLMKLILYLENPSTNLRSFNHNLVQLKKATKITFSVGGVLRIN
mgnify:CR=1 FL=1